MEVFSNGIENDIVLESLGSLENNSDDDCAVSSVWFSSSKWWITTKDFILNCFEETSCLGNSKA